MLLDLRLLFSRKLVTDREGYQVSIHNLTFTPKNMKSQQSLNYIK